MGFGDERLVLGQLAVVAGRQEGDGGGALDGGGGGDDRLDAAVGRELPGALSALAQVLLGVAALRLG